MSRLMLFVLLLTSANGFILNNDEKSHRIEFWKNSPRNSRVPISTSSGIRRLRKRSLFLFHTEPERGSVEETEKEIFKIIKGTSTPSVVANSQSKHGNAQATAMTKRGGLAISQATTLYKANASAKAFSFGGNKSDSNIAIARSRSIHGGRVISSAGTDSFRMKPDEKESFENFDRHSLMESVDKDFRESEAFFKKRSKRSRKSALVIATAEGDVEHNPEERESAETIHEARLFKTVETEFQEANKFQNKLTDFYSFLKPGKSSTIKSSLHDANKFHSKKKMQFVNFTKAETNLTDAHESQNKSLDVNDFTKSDTSSVGKSEFQNSNVNVAHFPKPETSSIEKTDLKHQNKFHNKSVDFIGVRNEEANKFKLSNPDHVNAS